MVEPLPPVTTVGFVDDYCNHYQDLFADVRNFEAFKFLHIGMISEMPRKSLPVIAAHCWTIECSIVTSLFAAHSVASGTDSREAVRVDQTMSWRTFNPARVLMKQASLKAGKTTDYVAKQYIGNLGKTDNGIVERERLCSRR